MPSRDATPFCTRALGAGVGERPFSYVEAAIVLIALIRTKVRIPSKYSLAACPSAHRFDNLDWEKQREQLGVADG